MRVIIKEYNYLKLLKEEEGLRKWRRRTLSSSCPMFSPIIYIQVNKPEGDLNTGSTNSTTKYREEIESAKLGRSERWRRLPTGGQSCALRVEAQPLHQEFTRED